MRVKKKTQHTTGDAAQENQNKREMREKRPQRCRTHLSENRRARHVARGKKRARQTVLLVKKEANGAGGKKPSYLPNVTTAHNPKRAPEVYKKEQSSSARASNRPSEGHGYSGHKNLTNTWEWRKKTTNTGKGGMKNPQCPDPGPHGYKTFTYGVETRKNVWKGQLRSFIPDPRGKANQST